MMTFLFFSEPPKRLKYAATRAQGATSALPGLLDVARALDDLDLDAQVIKTKDACAVYSVEPMG